MSKGVTSALIIVIVIVGIVGYGAIGHIYATSRISSAQKTLDLVVSHQNRLNTTFGDIDSSFKTLNGNSFNPSEAKNATDLFVANARAAVSTVDQDDASLATVVTNLNDQPWLTMVSRSDVDKESARIGHARGALADARKVAADYVLDGQFLQAFMDTIIDLDTLDTQGAAGDLNAEKATLGTMKTHVNQAAQMSTAPGLPAELHSLMVDFQTLVSDYGHLVDAALANDNAGVIANRQSVLNDANKVGAYDFNKIGDDINAFYKPLVDDFNAQMAAATA